MIDITSSVRETISKLNRLPKSLENAAMPAFKKSAETIRRIMARPGLPVTYPIHWDSLKQKIFVILKLKKENNLPYERTNEHVNSWEVSPVSNGSGVNGYQVSSIGHKAVFLHGTVTGHLNGAVHVQPSGQSHIFKDRWRLIRPVLDSVLSRLPENILKEFRIESNG